MNQEAVCIEKIEPYIEVLTALIAPTVAILGVYIAYQQYKTNKMKLKSDLFDRRYALYECVHDFVLAVVRKGGVNQSQRDTYIAGTKGAEFLFDKQIKEYIDEVWARSVDAGAWLEDQGLAVNHQDSAAHKKWFNEQIRTIDSKFQGYMSLSH